MINTFYGVVFQQEVGTEILMQYLMSRDLSCHIYHNVKKLKEVRTRKSMCQNNIIIFIFDKVMLAELLEAASNVASLSLL